MSSIEQSGDLNLRECAAGSEALLALWHDFLSGRMPHALLLTGDAGIGKKTAARLFAQGLMCRAEGDRPCGVCRDCRRFMARTHPDALFPAPAPKEKTLKIDALREMIDALSRHSLEGGNRTVLIENAERMTPQAQNCLLKTLEEAADDTYFLLTCDQESAMLPTIRSRCRCVRLQPWTEKRVEETLLRRGVTKDRAKALSVYCEGSLGRALQMQEDETYWQARETVRRGFLSVRSAADLPAAAQTLKDQKDNGDRLLDILEQEVRSLMRARASRTGELPDDFPPHWQDAPPLALRRVLEGVFDARRQKNANVGWAALSEGLLQTIAEEATKWQV